MITSFRFCDNAYLSDVFAAQRRLNAIRGFA
jgi:hypothetical protein